MAMGAAAQTQLTSPDGNYCFTFDQQADQLSYSLTYRGQTVVEHGQLGVQVDNRLVEQAMGIPTDQHALWTSGMRLIGEERLSRDTVWTPVYGENSRVRDLYNELRLHFSKGGGGQVSGGYNKQRQYLFDIIVRVYDEGVALRYHFPEATNGLFMHITRDLTTLRFAPGTQAWHTAWAQGHYHQVPLLTSDSAWVAQSERPLLLTLPNGLHVAVAEAALTDFARGKLSLTADHELGFSLYNSADVITPYDMPWRVIMTGERAVDLINHKDLLLNLNDPCPLTDTAWIRPGKAFRVTQLNQQAALAAVDFAVERGLQYIELDAGWYGPEMKVSSSALAVGPERDLDIAALCSYARSKGIGVWLYVNQRALSRQLDQLLPLYRQWGVSGIKFGFVQVGSQLWTGWLHEAVRKCAEHHIMVDIHDEYRPTGVSRTWPNLLTQEGIAGNEEMPDAHHNTVLPFTRFLCGPADYTLCYFNSRVKPTKAHQLAMAVVYYSPLTFMYWYDRPDAYRGERELDFWKHCPTVWDESRALDGAPGQYIVQARRSGNDWFVGIMTGMEGRTVELRTADFLPRGGRYEVEIYQDDPTLTTRTRVSTTVRRVRAGERLTLHLQPSGGAALRFVKR